MNLPEASPAQIEAAVAAARGAFSTWSRTTPGERSALLLKIADAIEADADAFAALESLNCGKPSMPCAMTKSPPLSIASASLPVPSATSTARLPANICPASPR